MAIIIMNLKAPLSLTLMQGNRRMQKWPYKLWTKPFTPWGLKTNLLRNRCALFHFCTRQTMDFESLRGFLYDFLFSCAKVFASMKSYDLGCSYGGGENTAAVFNDAGLAFISHSTTIRSMMRKGVKSDLWSGVSKHRLYPKSAPIALNHNV